MPRSPRQHQLNTSQIFHVINRGILRQTIFHDDADAFYFLQIFKRYKNRMTFAIYHWCLMPNHYHFVIEFFNGAVISKLIGACQQIYALYYHRKYNTAGKLFQNRFKSQAIEKENYLLTCGRYIELNPVRAGLIEYAWKWKWSSAKYYVDDIPDDITSIDPVWEESLHNYPDGYKDWLSDMKGREVDLKTYRANAMIIGSENFRKRHIIQNGHALLKQRGRPRKVITKLLNSK